jgi:hypothetical protein
VPALTSTAADRRRRRLRKALRVLSFCVALVLGVGAALAVLFHYAGGWGVPYFSFRTERGSTCVNTFTGFRCDQLTLDDVRFFSGVDLPGSTRVVTSHYRSTHDYQLQALLEVPPAGARAAQLALADTFGRCVQGHPSPLSGQPGLRRGHRAPRGQDPGGVAVRPLPLRDRTGCPQTFAPLPRSCTVRRGCEAEEGARTWPGRRWRPGSRSISGPRCPRRSRRRGS